jgi:hypothetical protein
MAALSVAVVRQIMYTHVNMVRQMKGIITYVKTFNK